MAETYQILDIYAIEPLLLHTLVTGLKSNSRFAKAISGVREDINTLLLARAVDALNFLVWTKTVDATHNRNRPDSIFQAMVHPEEKEEVGFTSAEEFEAERARILRKKEILWRQN